MITANCPTCGKEFARPKSHMNVGKTCCSGSCAMILRHKTEKIGFQTTHGMRNTKTYWTWVDMRNRCYRPSVDRYPHYGGRGIGVCERWRNSFENFYADMGDKPKGFSIERLNIDQDYSPENCTWIPLKHQARNRSDSIRIFHNGETKCIQEWADFFGVNASVARQRYHKNCTFDEIFSKTRLKRVSLVERMSRQQHERSL